MCCNCKDFGFFSQECPRTVEEGIFASVTIQRPKNREETPVQRNRTHIYAKHDEFEAEVMEILRETGK